MVLVLYGGVEMITTLPDSTS